MSETIDREVLENFDFFQSMLPELMKSNAGEAALIRHKEIVGFHPTSLEAFHRGHELYADGLFSIQEVSNRIYDLGFLSYANRPG